MMKLSSLKKIFIAKPTSGFTLTELLVSIIIGGLIVSSVTAIMSDIVRASKREEVETNTEKDIQRALNFIENDIEKAAYVYTGEQIREKRGAIAAIQDHFDVATDYQIVLAFWKPERIPYTPQGAKIPQSCKDGSGNIHPDLDADATIEQCQTLQAEQRTYTLVLYLQDNNPPNLKDGQSLIRRYELRRYSETDTYTNSGEDYLTLKTSENVSGKEIYVDPIKQAAGFSKWPYDNNDFDLQEATPTIDDDTTEVLVGFVDDPTNKVGNLPICLDEDSNNNGRLDTGEDTNGNGGLDIYSRTPDQSTSFFACVRQADRQGNFSQGNQDVLLYLRGNPDGRSGYRVNNNADTALPTLQTRVMLRGVIDKFLN